MEITPTIKMISGPGGIDISHTLMPLVACTGYIIKIFTRFCCACYRFGYQLIVIHKICWPIFSRIDSLAMGYSYDWHCSSRCQRRKRYYSNVIMGATASQITSLTIVYSTVYSGADQRKHQSSGSLAFVRGIHRWPVNSPHKWPVTRKMFPFDDVTMGYVLYMRQGTSAIWESRSGLSPHGILAPPLHGIHCLDRAVFCYRSEDK